MTGPHYSQTRMESRRIQVLAVTVTAVSPVFSGVFWEVAGDPAPPSRNHQAE